MSAHRKVMLSAMVLSILFLVLHILHPTFAGDTPYGGTGAMKVATTSFSSRTFRWRGCRCPSFSPQLTGRSPPTTRSTAAWRSV